MHHGLRNTCTTGPAYALDKNIDLFIGNLLYSTCLMGEIGPGAMYAGMSITGSLMDIPLSAEELASFQTANFEIPQGFWDELSPTRAC